MQETNQQPLFSPGQLVATPGALAALEKAGQGPLDFLRATFTAIGANCAKKTAEKTNSVGTGIPAPE